MFRKLSCFRFLTIAAAGLLASALAAPADAQYYKGKVITLLVGYSAGSGVTITGRNFAKVWPKHIPGKPKMIVKNMPGAGGIKAQNYIYEKAKADGLTIYWGPIGVVAKVVGRKSVRAEYHKLKYIGGYGNTLVTYTRKDAFSEYNDPTDVTRQVRPIKVGGSRPMSNLSVLHRLGFDLLGVKYRFVPGFRGSDKALKGILTKEIDSHTNPEHTYRFLMQPNLIRPGTGVGNYYYPTYDINGNPRPAASLPKMKSYDEVYRMVKGKKPSGPEWNAMKWISTFVSNLVYSAYAPVGTDMKLIKDLRAAYKATTTDPEYLAIHKKQYGEPPNFATIAIAENFLAGLANTDPQVKAVLKGFQKKARSK